MQDHNFQRVPSHVIVRGKERPIKMMEPAQVLHSRRQSLHQENNHQTSAGLHRMPGVPRYRTVNVPYSVLHSKSGYLSVVGEVELAPQVTPL